MSAHRYAHLVVSRDTGRIWAFTNRDAALQQAMGFARQRGSEFNGMPPFVGCGDGVLYDKDGGDTGYRVHSIPAFRYPKV